MEQSDNPYAAPAEPVHRLGKKRWVWRIFNDPSWILFVVVFMLVGLAAPARFNLGHSMLLTNLFHYYLLCICWGIYYAVTLSEATGTIFIGFSIAILLHLIISSVITGFLLATLWSSKKLLNLLSLVSSHVIK